MRLLRRKWLLIFLAILSCLVALGFYGYFALERAHKEFLESKWVRTTSGTVTGKELFTCKENGCFYVSGYGDRVEIKMGETQRRVYYRMDNFDQVDEPRRSRALQAESDRIAKLGARYAYDVDWYDKAKVGDKVEVRYRVFGDGSLQVWDVELSK